MNDQQKAAWREIVAEIAKKGLWDPLLSPYFEAYCVLVTQLRAGPDAMPAARLSIIRLMSKEIRQWIESAVPVY